MHTTFCSEDGCVSCDGSGAMLRATQEARHSDRRAEAGPADPHPWRAALLLGLLVIAAGMVWSTVLWPRIEHEPAGWWLPPPDVWHPLVAARQIVVGSFAHVYRPDSFYVAGPLFALFLAPVEAVASGFGLSESYPAQVARPAAWFVYGPYGLATGILLLYAVRALATEAGVRSGRLALQVGTVLLVMLPVGLAYGHYEDILALALVVLATRELLRGRPVLGAVVVGLAIATKQWAVLAVPVLVAAAPRGRKIRVLFYAAAVPAAFAAAPLLLDWSHASRSLFAARTFPPDGAAALWVSSGTVSIVGTPVRLGAVAVAVIVAWRLRYRASEPAALVGGLAVVLLARFLFEPVVYSYYLGPGLALLLVHEGVRGGRGLRTVVLGGGWLLWFQVWPATWWWWALTYALALGVSWSALRELLPRSSARLAAQPAS